MCETACSAGRRERLVSGVPRGDCRDLRHARQVRLHRGELVQAVAGHAAGRHARTPRGRQACASGRNDGGGALGGR